MCRGQGGGKSCYAQQDAGAVAQAPSAGRGAAAARIPAPGQRSASPARRRPGTRGSGPTPPAGRPSRARTSNRRSLVHGAAIIRPANASPAADSCNDRALCMIAPTDTRLGNRSENPCCQQEDLRGSWGGVGMECRTGKSVVACVCACRERQRVACWPGFRVGVDSDETNRRKLRA